MTPPENRPPDAWLPPGSTAPGGRTSGSGDRDASSAAPGTRAGSEPSPAPAPGPAPAQAAPTQPAPRPAASRGARVAVLGMVGVLVAGGLVDQLHRDRAVVAPTTSPTPTPSRTTPRPDVGSSTRAPDLPVTWRSSGRRLSPGDVDPRLTSPSGAYGGPRVVDGGTGWLVVTRDDKAEPEEPTARLHSLDPATGAVRWSRAAPDVLCATDLLDGHPVCLWATRHDTRSGLGTRWHVAVLDAATGRELRSATLDGWFTLATVQDGRLLLVEQRQPAPHAALVALDARLRTLWHADLRGQSSHDALFSRNRVIDRINPPDGPALFRPQVLRLREGRYLALSTGDATAVFEPASGRVVGVVPCSRMMDDGRWWWCNGRTQAVGLDEHLRTRVTASLGIRVAPVDVEAGQVPRPVFLSRDGSVVTVDPLTGRRTGTVVPSRTDGSLGIVLEPIVTQTAAGMVVTDRDHLWLLDRSGRRVVWRVPAPELSCLPGSDRGRVLCRRYDVTVFDARTGRVVTRRGFHPGFEVHRVGDPSKGQWISWGLEEFARVRMP